MRLCLTHGIRLCRDSYFPVDSYSVRVKLNPTMSRDMIYIFIDELFPTIANSVWSCSTAHFWDKHIEVISDITGNIFY